MLKHSTPIITFTGCELVNSSVRLVTYQNAATVKVTATGNDLSANEGQSAYIYYADAANVTKQDGFTIYP